ncbi:MAG: hypothetical protein Q8J78_05435 [Moraxellaceae bacterium]|nr:hypothetical protein [Moraxellaceae bacterium]
MAFVRGTFFAVMAMVASNVVLAEATPAAAWHDTYKCALRQHEMLTDYHLHASDPKDRGLLSSLLKSRQAASGCLSSVTDALGKLGLGRLNGELNTEQQKLSRALTSSLDTIAAKGVPENAVVAEMVQHQIALVAGLTGAAAELQGTGGAKISPESRQARELALVMEYANQRYIERTTQIYPRDDSAEPTIDELASRFGKGLVALRASKKINDAQRKKLDSVQTRFRFISSSLANYNDKTVPFTVNRHAHSMVDTLGELAQELESVK